MLNPAALAPGFSLNPAKERAFAPILFGGISSSSTSPRPFRDTYYTGNFRQARLLSGGGGADYSAGGR